MISSRYSIKVVCFCVVLLHVNLVLSFSTASHTWSSRNEPRKLFGGYRITPRFCKPTRGLEIDTPQGPSICMFNHECTQRNGEVVGACMDGFLFGTCCRLPAIETPVEISSDPVVMDVPSDQDISAIHSQFASSESDQIAELDKHNIYNGISTDRAPVNKFTSSIEYTNELPTQMVSNAGFLGQTERTPDLTSSGISQIANTLLENNVTENKDDYFDGSSYTHSSIDHVSAETLLLHLNGSQVTDVARPSDFTSGDEGSISSTSSISSSTRRPQDAQEIGNVNELIPKPIYTKPLFKPKPTKITPSDADKYVLVHTISNNKPGDSNKNPSESNKTPEIESIESIIMMLNDTNVAPEYNEKTSGVSEVPIYNRPSTKESFETTPYKNAGSSTTKLPSTSYVYSPTPTKRPGYEGVTKESTPIYGSSTFGSSSHLTNSYGQSTNGYTTYASSTTKLPSISYISSNPPQFISSIKSRPASEVTQQTASFSTTKKPPSTSYVYSPTPTKRPASNTQNVVSIGNSKPSNQNTKYPNVPPTVIVLSPISTESVLQKIESHTEGTYVKVTPTAHHKPGTGNNKKPTPQVSINNVVVSHDVVINGQTDKPSPTVLITPKPTTNLVTSSSWTQRPTINNGPTTISGPNRISSGSITKQPISTSQLVFASTPKPPSTSYIYSPVVTRRPDYKPTPPTLHGSTSNLNHHNNVETSTIKQEFQTSPDDLINFPPVRNPNLNISSGMNGMYGNKNTSVTFVDYGDIDFSTPSFMEDDNLDDKMNIFVNKIVESLQGPFQDLNALVYTNNKNSTASTGSNKVKPVAGAATTTLKPNKPVKKPATPTKRPTGTRRPTTSSKPQSGITTRKPSVTTKRPVVTTKKPLRITTPASTTKKPVVTRKPKPTTTKTPVRITTPTTKKPKPTRKATTTATTEVVYDEVEDETTTISATQTSDYKRQCGVRPHMKTGRIVGGKGATFGQWPWQVLVRESTWLGLFTKNKCGGVLITNKFVVTAAHCQPGFLASLVAVLGEFDISGDLESKRSVSKNVKRVIVHRQYDPATFENDLALLELESPVHYDTHIVPICMPPDNADFTGRMATVTGWGRLKYGGGVPSVLQEVQVPVIENSVCQEMFHTAGHSKTILNSFLCAGYANGQKDSCEGDSGGPLVLQRPDGRFELAGTVSHGIKCAAPYLPGVYMRTTFFKPWLQSITGVH